MSQPTKTSVVKKYVPTITVAFGLAFLVPKPIDLDQINVQFAGIALGIGLSYLIVFLNQWRKLNVSENTD